MTHHPPQMLGAVRNYLTIQSMAALSVDFPCP